jgi:transposase
VLADFAQHFGLGHDKHILLTVDQAGWHTSHKVVLPEGLHLELLPSYSPELQPAERLWSRVDEPLANCIFEHIEQLEQVLCNHCCVLLKQCEFIRGLTHFHWWQVANA